MENNKQKPKTKRSKWMYALIDQIQDYASDIDEIIDLESVKTPIEKYNIDDYDI